MNTVRSHLKAFVTQNYGSKLLALFLAVVSWYGIRKTISFEVTTPDVRVAVIPPPGFAVQFQSEPVVDVTFRGSQEDIRFLDVKRLIVGVDLQHINEAGSHEIPLSPSQVQGARGVRPFRVHPSRLRVELDREEEKRVPVRARIVGRPLSGQVESVLSDPPLVTLRGPARKLQMIDQVVTLPVDVDGRIESFSRRIAVAQPSDSWTAHIMPTEIQVEVMITARPSSREWLRQPVLALVAPHARRQIEIEPALVDVTVRGNADVLDRLDALLVLIDCTELKSGASYDLPVSVRVPDLDLTARADPSSVRVTVQDF